MPVFWFAVSQAKDIHIANTILIFVILHVLVYPASNGYNSYMDNDKGSIGGIENPLPVQRQLFHVTVLLDVIAVLLSFFISAMVGLAVFLYIIASRLYSYRGVRLKKYPVAGYLTVVICQGALVYCIVSMSANTVATINQMAIPAIISSLLIGGTYPLTQVYQHEQDKADGVTTLSYLLGVKGTFVYCGTILLMATLLLAFYLKSARQSASLFLYLTAMLPVVFFFTRWFLKASKDTVQASFKNMMNMNYIASVCSNAAFIGMAILNNV